MYRNTMQAVLPIAGKSSRMAKKYQGPKQLLPVYGKPLVEWTLGELPSVINELVLVVGGPYEQHIKEYFGDEHGGRKVTYVRQEEQLGLGHAIQQTRDTVKGRFLVYCPDDILSGRDLQKMVDISDLSILVHRRSDPHNFGVVVCDENNHVTRLVEKPKEFVSDLIVASPYVLDEEFFTIEGKPSARGEIELPDLVQALIQERGRTVQVVEAEMCIHVNDPGQLEEAERLMIERMARNTERAT